MKETIKYWFILTFIYGSMIYLIIGSFNRELGSYLMSLFFQLRNIQLIWMILKWLYKKLKDFFGPRG